MPDEVPFQIVTRAARRRALEEAEQAQTAGANAPITSVPTATVTALTLQPATASQRVPTINPQVALASIRQQRNFRAATEPIGFTRPRPRAGDDRQGARVQLVGWYQFEGQDQGEQEDANNHQEQGQAEQDTGPDMMEGIENNDQREREVS